MLGAMVHRREGWLRGAWAEWARSATVLRRAGELFFSHTKRDNASRLRRWRRLT